MSSCAGAVAGDTVTITAPANTRFTQTATVAFATGANAIASRSADGKTIKVLVGPGVTGAATVVGVTVVGATVVGVTVVGVTAVGVAVVGAVGGGHVRAPRRR